MQEEGGTSGLPATYVDCKERAQPRPRWPPSGPFPNAKAELRGCPQEVLSARKTCWPEALACLCQGKTWWRTRPWGHHLWAGLHL